MFKQLLLVAAIVGSALLIPAAGANAQHHGHGHSHHGHGHSGHGHFGHSHRSHFGHGHHHFGRHSHGHGFDIHIGGHHHGFGHYYYPSWGSAWPSYSLYYPDTYYLGSAPSYYTPRTYVNVPSMDRTYVSANSATAPSLARTYVVARPTTIQFGGFAHVDDLSARLDRLANELCLDLHHNYRHNAGFDDVYRAAYQMYETARFLRSKESQADRAELAQRVNELDGLFHQLQTNVRGWSRVHSRQIGNAGALTKLDQLGTTLHDLTTDVGVRAAHGAPAPAVTPGQLETAPPPMPMPPPMRQDG